MGTDLNKAILTNELKTKVQGVVQLKCMITLEYLPRQKVLQYEINFCKFYVRGRKRKPLPWNKELVS